MNISFKNLNWFSINRRDLNTKEDYAVVCELVSLIFQRHSSTYTITEIELEEIVNHPSEVYMEKLNGMPIMEIHKYESLVDFKFNFDLLYH